MSFLTDNKKLRDLIINNPDLPLLFFATEDANNGDCSTMSCDIISCYIDEVLDTRDTPKDDKIYMDRDDLEEDIADLLWDDFADDHNITWKEFEGSKEEKEFDELVKKELAKYELYWKKAIIVICG